MAASTPRTIMLTLDSAKNLAEAQAGGTAITPGMLCQFDAANNDDIVPHSTADGAAQAIFAVENPIGTPVSGTAAIDVAYGTADTVTYVYAQPGDQIYAYATQSATITVGEYLVSAGDGYLQDEGGTPVPGSIVARALEAVTAGTADPARIKVEVV